MAPSGIVGRLIKFSKEGKFIFADDGEAIAESEDFVVLADQTLVSWVKFNGEGEPPTRIGGLLYQGFVLPPRDAARRHRPARLADRPVGQAGRPVEARADDRAAPADNARAVHVLDHDQDRAPRGRQPAAGTTTGCRPATPGAFPVVRLKPSGYQDSRFGWVHTPLFVVVGMAAGHSGRRAGHVAQEPKLNDEIPF